MSVFDVDNDLIGQAIWDYWHGDKDAEVLLGSSIEERGPLPVSHFFRAAKELPQLERLALELAQGEILDIGAGAGCHSIILQETGFKVTAIDASPKSVEVMQDRGLNAIASDFLSYSTGTYDTLYLLMNGLGIAGTLQGLELLLKHASELLRPGGQIIADSSDIIYAYEEDDGSVYLDLNGNYYGEVQYEIEYKNRISKTPWLFVDAFKVNEIAAQIGLEFQLLEEGPHYDFLCRLTKKD